MHTSGRDQFNPLHRYVTASTTLEHVIEGGYTNRIVGARKELDDARSQCAALFSREVVSESVRLAANDCSNSGGIFRRRAVLLLGGFLRSELTKFAVELSKLELESAVEFRGRLYTFRELPVAVVSATDRTERDVLAAEYERLVQAMAGLRVKMWETRYRLINEVGLGTYADTYSKLYEIDLDSLCEIAETVLARTDEAYRLGVARYGDASLLRRSEGQWHDLQVWMRGKVWDSWFPAELITHHLEQLASALLQQPVASFGVTLDLAPRPDRSSRSFCAALAVPGDIRLVVNPGSGHRDYEAAYHELGHVLHFCSTPKGIAWEYRLMPDDIVAETHAYALSALLRSVRYLSTHLGFSVDAAKSYAAFAQFIEIIMVRKYCSKVLFELVLHEKGEPTEADVLARPFVSRALGVTHPRGWSLLDLDGGLYAAQYLMAWVVWAELHTWMRRISGGDWFESATGRGLMREQWRYAGTDSYRNLCNRIGIERPRPEVLVDLLGRPAL